METYNANKSALHLLEQNFYAFSSSKGRLVDMSDSTFAKTTRPMIEHIANKLALAGYRPSGSERLGIVFCTFVPFLILLFIGVLMLLYSFSTDMGSFFLIPALMITFVTGIIISATTKKNTPLGRETLKAHQNSLRELQANNNHDRVQLASYSLALFGASALTSYPEFANLSSPIQSLNHAPQSSGGADGGGCGSSGCGSSGCGSSGCGSSGCGSSGCGSSGCGGGCGGGGD